MAGCSGRRPSATTSKDEVHTHPSPPVELILCFTFCNAEHSVSLMQLGDCLLSWGKKICHDFSEFCNSIVESLEK